MPFSPDTPKGVLLIRRCAVLLHPDADYAGRLADFWNQRKSLGFPVYAFSTPEASRASRTCADVELLLFSEHFAEEMQGLLRQGIAILLSEDNSVGRRCQNALSVPVVFSYRLADALACHVTRFYAAAGPGSFPPVQHGDCEILGIYSPVHHCGKTISIFSLRLARVAQSKTLLLSLGDYTDIYVQITPDVTESLSELLFAHSSGRYSWTALQNRLPAFGVLDPLPPVYCMEDLSLLPSKELAALSQRITRESGYRSMMLDSGTFGRRALELLELHDRIFMPALPDPLSVLKLSLFRRYLRQNGHTQLLEKAETPELPPGTEKTQGYACALLPAYENGSLYEFAVASY